MTEPLQGLVPVEPRRLRLALPKGRLCDGVAALLAEAGFALASHGERNYRPTPSDPAWETKLVKVRAVPQLVALGNFDAGFCGLDLVREADFEDVVPVVDLGLAPVRLVVAVPRGHEDLLEHPPRRPLLIASEYVSIADRWALGRGLAHITIQTWGSTEAYAPEDADIVFDCSETGATLRANDLVVIEELMASSTHLVACRRSLGDPARRARIERMAADLGAALERRRAHPLRAPEESPP